MKKENFYYEYKTKRNGVIFFDIENSNMSLEKLHSLTAYILKKFEPIWYEAKQEITKEEKTVWFHGFEVEIGGDRWNFDLWFFDQETIDKAEEYCAWVEKGAYRDEKTKHAILTIKENLIARGIYSFDQYNSMDVYDAVLNFGIRDTETFLNTYKKRR